MAGSRKGPAYFCLSKYSLFAIFFFVWKAGNCDQISTADAGSIKEVPDQFVIFKGSCYIKDLGATRADVKGTKVP